MVKKLFASLTLITLLATIAFGFNYRDSMDLAKDPVFVQRVKYAMINTAITVSNESTGTTNHVNRTAFAKACLNSPDQYAQLLAVGVAADSINFPATITRDANGNVTSTNGASSGADAGIDGRLLNIWNNYSGLP